MAIALVLKTSAAKAAWGFESLALRLRRWHAHIEQRTHIAQEIA
jgi:hypothetical protein